jgi:hypothetical protein
MISDTEKLALVRASKDLTTLELIEATCEACRATFITSDIARAEREECAKLMQSMRPDLGQDNPYAKAIRARGEQ